MFDVEQLDQPAPRLVFALFIYTLLLVHAQSPSVLYCLFAVTTTIMELIECYTQIRIPWAHAQVVEAVDVGGSRCRWKAAPAARSSSPLRCPRRSRRAIACAAHRSSPLPPRHQNAAVVAGVENVSQTHCTSFLRDRVQMRRSVHRHGRQS